MGFAYTMCLSMNEQRQEAKTAVLCVQPKTINTSTTVRKSNGLTIRTS